MLPLVIELATRRYFSPIDLYRNRPSANRTWGEVANQLIHRRLGWVRNLSQYCREFVPKRGTAKEGTAIDWI